MIETVEFDIVEFLGTDGEVHAVRQCSLLNRAEFTERLKQIQKKLESTNSEVGVLYDNDPYFKSWVNRCLELCGIKPEWVGLQELIGLLFPHRSGAEIKPGWLIALNFPPPKPSAKDDNQGEPQKEQTVAEAIAALSTFCESVEEAYRLARNEPFGQLNDVLEARATIAHNQRMKSDKKYAEAWHKKESQRKARNSVEDLSAKLFAQAVAKAKG